MTSESVITQSVVRKVQGPSSDWRLLEPLWLQLGCWLMPPVEERSVSITQVKEMLLRSWPSAWAARRVFRGWACSHLLDVLWLVQQAGPVAAAPGGFCGSDSDSSVTELRAWCSLLRVTWLFWRLGGAVGCGVG